MPSTSAREHARLPARPTHTTTFDATLLRPAKPDGDDSWAFVVLPKAASDTLPRRGRVAAVGTLNGAPFEATLEPDGQLSHWFKVSAALREAAGAAMGGAVSVQVRAATPQPEPQLPDDLRKALAAAPAARAVWDATTTLARVDWVHWIESAKQATTRKQRVQGACDRLAAGKRSVCCFDVSGYYSKGLKAPQAAAAAS